MIKQVSLWCFIVLLSGCSSLVENDTLVKRKPLAQSLEAQQRYADALTQWRILQLAFPNDQSVAAQIDRLHLLISDRLVVLFEELEKAHTESKKRNVYLKILALDPNNEVAIEELRKFEWQDALSKAVQKTRTIKKYFVENQKKAKRSIQLEHFLDQGEQFAGDKKYNALLQLADNLEAAYPNNPKPKEYRLLAYTKLAERSVKDNDLDAAISLFDKAIETDKGSNKALVAKSQKLKKKLGTKYLTLGLKTFKTDLDKAIEYFELSIKYQPDNDVALAQLQRATKVRENLNRIKKLNASSS